MPPLQLAENWPAIDVADWLEIVHCTLSHVGVPGIPGTTPAEVYDPATEVVGVLLGAVTTDALC